VGASVQQCIEVDRHCGYQRLAFTGLHLGYSALVQDNAAYQLHVKGPHVHRAFGNFPNDRKCLDQEIIQCLSGGQPAQELVSHRPQLSVCAPFHLGLQFVYGIYLGLQFPYFAVVASANDPTQ
jgi:hypothetical protein